MPGDTYQNVPVCIIQDGKPLSNLNGKIVVLISHIGKEENDQKKKKHHYMQDKRDIWLSIMGPNHTSYFF